MTTFISSVRNISIETPAARGSAALKSRDIFLKKYPLGFLDKDYLSTHRGPVERAHLRWTRELDAKALRQALAKAEYADVIRYALAIEAPAKLLSSRERSALGELESKREDAQLFVRTLDNFINGRASIETRFAHWIEALGELERQPGRLLNWPVATCFNFLARPRDFFFVRPLLVRQGFARYGILIPYSAKPSWEVYLSQLVHCAQMREGLADLGAEDSIDVLAFLRVIVER